MTYNHEKFIAKAIESVLAQKVDFKYEIVIGDDFSTDGTLGIANRFEEKYPEKVRVLKRKKGDAYHQKRVELGRLYNFTNIISNCRGKYIALLDGDDFFLDENKLQRQVDLLEKNTEYSFCFHDIETVDEKGIPMGVQKIPLAMLKNLSQPELVGGTYPCPPTASVMYRRSALLEFPEWFYQMNGDYAISVLLAQYGGGACIDGKLSAYRYHSGGIWTAGNEVKKLLKTIQMRRIVLEQFKLPGREMNVKILVDTYLLLLKKHLFGKRLSEFLKSTSSLFGFLMSYPNGLNHLAARLIGMPPANNR